MALYPKRQVMDPHARTAVVGSWHRKHFKELVNYADSIVKNPHDAEDIVQDLFAKLIEHGFNYDNRGDPRPFLFTSVKNACIDHLRKDRISEKDQQDLAELEIFTGSSPSHEDAVIRAELMAMLDRFIQELPPQGREAIQKTFEENKSVKEAALELRVVLSTFDKRRRSALKVLFKKLKKHNLPLFLCLLLICRHYRN